MHLPTYLAFLRDAEDALARSYRVVSDAHAADTDVHFSAARFAAQCDAHAAALGDQLRRLGPPPDTQPDRMPVTAMRAGRVGPAGLLRDLLDLHQLACTVEATWTVIGQAAQGARDTALLGTVRACEPEVTAQLAWLTMTLKASAPQTLLVAD